MKKLVIAFDKIEKQDGCEITFSSAEYWKVDGVRRKFSAVYAPNNPEIIEAYSEYGIPEFKINADSEDKSVKPAKDVNESEVELVKDVAETESTAVEIQEPVRRAGRKPKSKEE